MRDVAGGISFEGRFNRAAHLARLVTGRWCSLGVVTRSFNRAAHLARLVTRNNWVTVDAEQALFQ